MLDQGWKMRSEAVRLDTLKRDGYKCQITGAGGPEWGGVVDVDHWCNLGAGGSEELDDVKNCITLESEIHRTHKHGATITKIRIVHWDPDDLENGLVVERRSLEGKTIGEWEPYPKWELWYYRRQLVEHVKENLGNMHSIQTLTGYHAMTMFELRLVWEDIEPTAKSFDQLVSSMGWDPEKANAIADKHVWLLDHKSQWPEGLTEPQLTEIIDREAPMTLFDKVGEEHPTETMQAFLSAAAEKSFTDLKNAMIKKGLRIAQPFYYVVMPAAYLPVDGYRLHGTDMMLSRMTIIQSRDEEGMKAAIRAGEICLDIENPVVFRIGKAVMNLLSRKNVMRLGDGTKVKVLYWPITAADMLAGVPEAYGIEEGGRDED
jgi:hypothetical protein